MQHYNETFFKFIIDVNFSIDFKHCPKRNCKDILYKFSLTIRIYTYAFGNIRIKITFFDHLDFVALKKCLSKSTDCIFS